MPRKIKIFGYQINIEWYHIKTKFKQLLRRITYSNFIQDSIAWFFFFYSHLVYKTSKVEFINQQILIKAAKEKRPIIISFWHNRLMMIPFLTRKPRKLYKDYKIMTLASRHGDGRFVGKVMEKFGFISILGSTKRSKKSSRGIEISSLREILRGLKKGHSLGITPDGPRGPNQKISGELINLAKLSGAEILPVSQTTSNFIQFNSWDKFKFPLPFSKICFYFAEETIKVSKNLDQKELDDIAQLAEDKMNLVQENSQIRAL